MRRIPCVLMRGGTSKGLIFHADHLPTDPDARDRILLRAMGSPDVAQIDGVGGATTLTSKVAIVRRSRRPEADVDYLFAQVNITAPVVDTNPSCGNILSAVAPYAVESGMVAAQQGETTVRIFNENTRTVSTAIVQTPGGLVTYDGAARIDGVPGSAAPVKLDLAATAGSRTGKLLPTGAVRDVVNGIEISCVDMSVPMVLIPAAALGRTGYESKQDLDADHELLARIEEIRREASHVMGLGDATGKVIPKVALLAAPRGGSGISSRYFVPHVCHATHAVTGAVCIAVATGLEGTVAHELAKVSDGPQRTVRIEHPAGGLDVELAMGDGLFPTPDIRRAAVVRTARRIFEGSVVLPLEV
ncbi:4-oxalomesaconate tautomerase [Streptomyces piniterrae]|uniref:4-oxalomesaconate tautomerase n=1 Tax=Streptomyces piniterrae TaxID=2571125 RepID=A0A4U0NWL3_9ACTN|nr:4-oxalomesaconate tautomerase [Streptomyces piniterrae]TJZ59113.1 4-oxalomesaconate tautomerase [Streptomyces piniterrae]